MAAEIGAVVKGKVTGITKFGAFVEMDGGGTGLCHISEIADGYVKDVNDFLVNNQEVTVKVIGDKDGKISLSIRQAQPKQENTRDHERPKQQEGKPFKKRTAPGQSIISKFGDVLDQKNTEKQGNLDAMEQLRQ